ncbi:hypothetical protein Tco_0988081 [Tanacetum coccineum]|uniref:Uncharacterized protein n=1 Tax=Tanacetum coccineum TaxID=301880 RepID=A0ABQ5EQ57_9ASTR
MREGTSNHTPKILVVQYDALLSHTPLPEFHYSRFQYVNKLPSGGENRLDVAYEEGDDFGLDVLRFHTCLTDILGFLEKLEWWFEQDIDDEEEKDEEGESGSEMEKDAKDGLAKQGNDSLRM